MVSSEAGDPLDRVPDLDLATAELAQREERLRQEYERNERLLAVTAERAADTVGTGRAEDGAVTITVDANQRIVGVALEPRALRLGSIGRLEQAILTACQAAEDDVAHRLGRSIGDPIRQFLESMPELRQLLPAESYGSFLEPDRDQPPARPTPRRPPPTPAERSIYE